MVVHINHQTHTFCCLIYDILSVSSFNLAEKCQIVSEDLKGECCSRNKSNLISLMVIYMHPKNMNVMECKMNDY